MSAALLVLGAYALLIAGLCAWGARATRRRDMLSFDLTRARGTRTDEGVSRGRTL